MPETGRQRHPQRLGDLRTGEPQPPQTSDRLDPLLAGAMRDRPRRGGPIVQPELALGPIAPYPLARAADTDSGGLGRLRHRPFPAHNPTTELSAAFQTERRVSVKLHPVSSLGRTEVLGSSQPPRRPGWTNLLRNYT
jgi:hypothetical protein